MNQLQVPVLKLTFDQILTTGLSCGSGSLLQSSLTWQSSLHRMETQVRLTTLLSELIISLLSRVNLSRVVSLLQMTFGCVSLLLWCHWTKGSWLQYELQAGSRCNTHRAPPSARKWLWWVEQKPTTTTGEAKKKHLFNSTSLSQPSVSLQAWDEDVVTHSKSIREEGGWTHRTRMQTHNYY